MNHVLFICTGNYYRSRYAEALFNYEAELRGLGWRAFSRGLAIHSIDGDLSPHTREALDREAIPLSCTAATRQALTAEDLEHAGKVIALKEAEHKPMMVRQFPDWAERITYWGVHDLDVWVATQTLPAIKEKVGLLLEEIASTEEEAKA